ncbi:hypothetical protein [Pseudomonas chlororaphis]|uniref:hypothetical protein n=1 Tax=Pseudomonas chlororaphis TaxID=587753 RepID=UPI00050D1099|nr:hypothetical protein [Pseudomonas chlororaphis]AIS13711.1 hypothetical protein JM49_19255 [Pseudomonas chlororaphis subsp. aurantiaca]
MQVKAGMRLEVERFGLLNRLIHFLVRRMRGPEPLSLYLLSYRGSVLRVPAEAIHQHPDYRLADFRHWKEQATQATRQM